jgi:hypothetical protein
MVVGEKCLSVFLRVEPEHIRGFSLNPLNASASGRGRVINAESRKQLSQAVAGVYVQWIGSAGLERAGYARDAGVLGSRRAGRVRCGNQVEEWENRVPPRAPIDDD